MAELDMKADGLYVRLSPKEKLGALGGDRFVRRGSISSVRYLDNARHAIRGLRLPGTGLPGVIALGTWRTRSTSDFVAVYRNDPGYAIELTDGNRIVVSHEPIAELEALLAN